MNIQHHLEKVRSYFSPKVIEEVNDVFVKVAKIKGEDIPWHAHENEDELFYILHGSLKMELKDDPPFVMHKGDIFTVKKGVYHRVSSDEECHIMLIENKTTAHTGDVFSPITKSIQDQLGE